MNPAHKLFAVSTVALAAQATQSLATVVEYDLPSTVTSSSGPFSLFVPITPNIPDANAFLSIDNGSVFGAEGATFTVVAEFADVPDVMIYQHTFPFSGGSFSLTSIPLKSFSAGVVEGLRFVGSNSFVSPLNIPAGTTFSFNSLAVIPEPASATFWVGVVATGVYANRRRRRDEADTTLID